MKKQKKYKASVLVVTMAVLGAMLVIAISISAVAIHSRTSSIGDSKSSVAYQNAETGVEKVMNAILENSSLTLDSLGSDWTCNSTSGHAILTSVDGKFTAELKKADDSDPTPCDTTQASEIVSIKSIGSSDGETNKRAIEVAVAATASGGVTGGCTVTSSSIIAGWGNGCQADGSISSLPGTYALWCDFVEDTDYDCGPSSVGSYTMCICVDK